MSKKPNLLRDALKNMRVSAPSFKAPIDTQMEAPRNEVPLSQSAPNRAPQKGTPKKEVAQTEVPASKAPQKEQPQVEVALSEVPQDEIPQKEVAENGLSQNGVTQNEPPQTEVPEDKLADSSFFRLSHRVFSDEKLQRMSGDCFRLFLWMASKAWRYPNSDGRVRAAIRFIEEGTGMSHANVSRCLKTLKDLGLIRVAQTDFKQGNIWWVSPLACPNGGGRGGGGKVLPRKEVPQREAAQDRNGAASKRVSGSLKKNMEVPRFEGQIKKLRSSRKIKEPVVATFQVPVDDERDFSGNPEEVLTAFEAEFADEEQSKLVMEFMAREYPHGFTPPMRVVRSLTAMAWYRNSSSLGAIAC